MSKHTGIRNYFIWVVLFSLFVFIHQKVCFVVRPLSFSGWFIELAALYIMYKTKPLEQSERSNNGGQIFVFLAKIFGIILACNLISSSVLQFVGAFSFFKLIGGSYMLAPAVDLIAIAFSLKFLKIRTGGIRTAKPIWGHVLAAIPFYFFMMFTWFGLMKMSGHAFRLMLTSNYQSNTFVYFFVGSTVLKMTLYYYFLKPEFFSKDTIQSFYLFKKSDKIENLENA